MTFGVFLAAYFLYCRATCDLFIVEVKSGVVADCQAVLAERPDLALGCFWIPERHRAAVMP